MGRPATGHLCDNRSGATGRLTSWGMQFVYAGRQRYLTLPARTRDQALREMAVVMEEVHRGSWMPPRPRRPTRAQGPAPSFEAFAGAWIARHAVEGGRRRTGLSRAGQADSNLQAKGRQPLPSGLTPHSLRRTFASLLFALGEPPTYVMSQMGHTTPVLTLALYAREMNRRDGERARLKALVCGGWPRIAAYSSTTTSSATWITRSHGPLLEICAAELDPDPALVHASPL